MNKMKIGQRASAFAVKFPDNYSIAAGSISPISAIVYCSKLKLILFDWPHLVMYIPLHDPYHFHGPLPPLYPLRLLFKYTDTAITITNNAMYETAANTDDVHPPIIPPPVSTATTLPRALLSRPCARSIQCAAQAPRGRLPYFYAQSQRGF
jgi:hypothetical protein